MKQLLIAAAVILAASALPAQAQIGVSINIGEPNFYGRIDLNDAPPPRVIYTQPVIVERTVVGEPVYLRVPTNHRKNWKKYCRQYDACGRQVYFVRNDWYQNDYAPHYREQHRPDHNPGEHGEHHDQNRDGSPAHGHGHDHGHDHDHHN